MFQTTTQSITHNIQCRSTPATRVTPQIVRFLSLALSLSHSRPNSACARGWRRLSSAWGRRGCAARVTQVPIRAAAAKRIKLLKLKRGHSWKALQLRWVCVTCVSRERVREGGGGGEREKSFFGELLFALSFYTPVFRFLSSLVSSSSVFF